jgi:hypothetical protein
MAKNNRVIDLAFLEDPLQIKSVQYNPASGGQKSLIVGPRLIPIQIAGGYTTNVSTGPVALPYLGANLAIYNNSRTAGSVTAGDSTITALAIGATDANGNVGVACAPNAYTYLSLGNHRYVVSNASTLIVYIIEDPTRFAQETGPFINQNIPGFVPPVSS